MDLAVLLPLSALFVLQALLAAALLAPRAVSAHAARLVALAARPNVAPVVYTAAAAVGVMAASSAVQLAGVMRQLRQSSVLGDRALALSVEELRALLALVLGASNLLLVLLLRALAAEQTHHDRAKLSHAALLRQTEGLRAEYTRATSAGAGGGGGGGGGGGEAVALKAQVDKLIREKSALMSSLDEALAAKRTAEASTDAVKSQYKGLEREYDRLLAELERVQGSVGAGGADKKSR